MATEMSDEISRLKPRAYRANREIRNLQKVVFPVAFRSEEIV
ncbi:hypothetical protein LCGC14_1782570 [marine sediment metagenome]|uniref:Uncharacterized protein n=1 Tax=marine sediment metagenome TaxID=412755 RepID=A0A0F9J9V0_9ZZZZ